MTIPDTTLALAHGDLALPDFLPDATRGFVRCVDPADLRAVGVRALVMNVFHLMRRPGATAVDALGGLHRFSGWRGPVVTDSGGFQAFSELRARPRHGRVSDRGLTLTPEGAARKFHLTPEKSVRHQVQLGADLVICLDDCTHVDDSPDVQARAVERTVRWARRGKEEFRKLLDGRRDDAPPPLLFAVIQGGGSPELRRRCAGDLLDLGFDGFGFGGWPLDGSGTLLEDLLGRVREFVPRRFPLFALGVGHPSSVQRCARMGYGLFDSAMPTRDARHGRLTVDAGEGRPAGGFDYLNIRDDRHRRDDGPLSAACDCPACGQFSRGFLHHCFALRDPLGARAATLHNLRFMARWMERLRAEARP